MVIRVMWLGCAALVLAHAATGAPAKAPGAAPKAAQGKAGSLSKAQLEALDAESTNLYYDHRYAAAAAIQQRMEDAAPNSAEVAYNYGLTLLKLKKLDEAQQRFERAGKLSGPDKFMPPLMLGEVAMQRGDLARAWELLDRSRKIGPQYGPPIYHMGVIHMKRGERAEAERAFRQALTLDPWPEPSTPANAANDLGLLLEVRGQYAEAKRLFRRAQEEDPGNKAADYNLSRQGKAVSSEMGGILPVPGPNRFPDGVLQMDAQGDTPGQLIGWSGGLDFAGGARALASPNLQLLPKDDERAGKRPRLIPVTARFEIRDAAQPSSLRTSFPVSPGWKTIELHVSMRAFDVPKNGKPLAGGSVTGVSTRWLGHDLKPIKDGPQVPIEGTCGVYRIETGEVPPGAARLEVEMGLFAPSGRIDIGGIAIFADPVYPVPYSVPAPQ